MIAYLDTSVLLGKLFNDAEIVVELEPYSKLIASELILVEGSRTIDRLRIDAGMDDEEAVKHYEHLHAVIKSVELIRMSKSILKRASESFPTVLGTLDSIHLASQLLWSSVRETPVTLLTHDKQFSRAARALGIEVKGV